MPGLITSLVSKRGAPAFHRILPGSTQCVVTREGLEIPGLRSYDIFSQKRGKSVMVDSHEETQRMIVHFNRAEIPELYMLLSYYGKFSSGISAQLKCASILCGDVWLCFGYPSANHLAADRGELGRCSFSFSNTGLGQWNKAQKSTSELQSQINHSETCWGSQTLDWQWKKVWEPQLRAECPRDM
ncbi:hypothetical protein K438DRAFT_1780563 [Mycena galopus ATCC 62051]|nr:hypothetical protein K438DRAFT_1780563 [Mycena galopus ATCC 62051]